MDQAEANATWEYDQDIGLLRWRVLARNSNGKANYLPGDIAGCRGTIGYIAVGWHRKQYTVHRLAWLMMTGRWPTEIDHVNGDRADNRWVNLREVTRTQNNLNKRVKGYTLSRGGKFVAQLKVNRVKRHLGTFDTAEEARAAHAAARAAAFR